MLVLWVSDERGVFKIIFLVLLPQTIFAGGCRDVVYNLPINDKALPGHVIARMTVADQDQCGISCYMNPDCISVNYNTLHGAAPNCELSSSNDQKNLIKKSGVIFHSMENNCRDDLCAHQKTTCQSGYTSKGYQCVCPKCSSGKDCRNYDQDTTLLFPKQSIDQTVIMENPFRKVIYQFTISFWVQVQSHDKQSELTVMSYTLRRNPNFNLLAIALEKYEKIMRVFISSDDSSSKAEFNAQDGKWYHMAVSWDKNNLFIFIDGVKLRVSRGSKRKFQLTNIQIRGALVLGQDQDAYLGGYNVKQSFQGNLTSFNMWNWVLSNSDISELARQRCPSKEGNILKWTDLIRGRNQYVQFFCGSKCK